MRIFIEELQISLDVDDSTFNELKSWIGVFDSILTPITDKKAQLQLDGEYLVETFADFAKFYRFFSASSALLGGILLLSANIFKLNYKHKERFLDLEPDQIITHEEFKQYLATPEYKTLIDGVVSIGATRSEEDARRSIRETAKRIGELIFNNAVEKNIDSIFRLPDILIRGVSTINILQARDRQKCLNIWIEEDGLEAQIFFNGSEQEYALLDKWLGSPELNLPRWNNHYVIHSKTDFIQWFNALRSKLDSECNYATLMHYIDQFPKDQAELYSANVRNKITAIASENSQSIYETRLRVIAYINRILNSRKGFAAKTFEEIKEDELDALLSPEDQAYILSLYQ